MRPVCAFIPPQVLQTDIFGTSANSIFSLALQSGQTLSTSNTELLANPVFCSSVVPEPSQLALAGLVGLTLLLRRRK